MTQLVFLLEEGSMRELLNGLLPRMIPGVEYVLVPHEGKSDLEQSIPRKLKAWRRPGARFIIVRDQDAADCRVVKDKLQQLAASSGRTAFRVRVACRCLEAWVLGDLPAVAAAFGRPTLREEASTRKFRDPDRLADPVGELRRLVPGYQKTAGARAVGVHIDASRSASHSFRVFWQAVMDEASRLGTEP
jgi:hypothetical protein